MLHLWLLHVRLLLLGRRSHIVMGVVRMTASESCVCVMGWRTTVDTM